MPSWPVHRDLEAFAAKTLRHDGVNVGAVKYHGRTDAVLPLRIVEEVAHAAQISFALFTHVADKQYPRFIAHGRCLQRSGNRVKTHDACAVVADAGKKNLALL